MCPAENLDIHRFIPTVNEARALPIAFQLMYRTTVCPLPLFVLPVFENMVPERLVCQSGDQLGSYLRTGLGDSSSSSSRTLE